MEILSSGRSEIPPKLPESIFKWHAEVYKNPMFLSSSRPGLKDQIVFTSLSAPLSKDLTPTMNSKTHQRELQYVVHMCVALNWNGFSNELR